MLLHDIVAATAAFRGCQTTGLAITVGGKGVLINQGKFHTTEVEFMDSLTEPCRSTVMCLLQTHSTKTV